MFKIIILFGVVLLGILPMGCHPNDASTSKATSKKEVSSAFIGCWSFSEAATQEKNIHISKSWMANNKKFSLFIRPNGDLLFSINGVVFLTSGDIISESKNELVLEHLNVFSYKPQKIVFTVIKSGEYIQMRSYWEDSSALVIILQRETARDFEDSFIGEYLSNSSL